jgi:hypothetical protein
MKSHAYIALFALVGGLASAQEMKPGLWETQTRMKGGQMEQAMAQMQTQMANMPPEQRKMVQEMMAKHGVAMAGNTMTAKVCVTQEQINKGQMQVRGDCTTTRTPGSGSTVKWTMSCPKMSGSGEMTMKGDSAYHMAMDVTSTEGGQPQHMQMEVDGKRVGDCAK